MEETFQAEPVNCLIVRLLPGSGLATAGIDAKLRAGDPVIRTVVAPDLVAVVVETVSDPDVETIVERLREACGAQPPSGHA